MSLTNEQKDALQAKLGESTREETLNRIMQTCDMDPKKYNFFMDQDDKALRALKQISTIGALSFANVDELKEIISDKSGGTLSPKEASEKAEAFIDKKLKDNGISKVVHTSEEDLKAVKHRLAEERANQRDALAEKNKEEMLLKRIEEASLSGARKEFEGPARLVSNADELRAAKEQLRKSGNNRPHGR